MYLHCPFPGARLSYRQLRTDTRGVRLPTPYRTVIFDCDSTLSRIEGIEELSDSNRAEVVALTTAAMAGDVPLEEVYGRRLELIRPTIDDVERVGERYIKERIPGVEDVVRRLQQGGVEVRVISGGLLPAVLVLTRFLGLEDEAVAAVDLRFDPEGNYAGFDERSPLARSGGKSEVLGSWRDFTSGPRMLVGDGATDLEAKDEVDLFVAFTGVVRRPAVVAGADFVIKDASLNAVLDLTFDTTTP